MNKHLLAAEKYAREYDKGAADQGYFGPEIMFGLMYEFLERGYNLLDIAIGTGLDAALFQKAGVKVFGIDGAAEMLKICREKGVAEELRQADVLNDKFPFPEAFFELALANALFHMTEDPSPVFFEAARLLKDGGIFGFTIDESFPWKSGNYLGTIPAGVSSSVHPESGLNMYRHSEEFILEICLKSGFENLKKCVFRSFNAKEGMDDFYFSAFITRKINHG